MGATIQIAAAFLIALLAFTLNWAMREKRGYALSAAADFALAIAALDLAMFAASHSIQPVIPDPLIRTHFHALIVISFCFTILVWFTILLPIEHKMTERFDYRTSTYTHERPMVMALFFLAWILIVPICCAHVFIFVYGVAA